MELSKDRVKKIATLARLRLTDDKMNDIHTDLNKILSWVEQLAAVDTSSVKPMQSVNVVHAPLRADQINDGDKADDVLANAPGGAVESMFSVPKVIE